MKDQKDTAIETVTDFFMRVSTKRLNERYQNPLPAEVSRRATEEFDAIVQNVNEYMYLSARCLVQCASENGKPTSAIGSIGSSFTAFLSGITDINPLRPHYYCKKCKSIEFVQGVASGYDLPDMSCPQCGDMMAGDGHDIPFESFGGLCGDKAPDILISVTSEAGLRCEQTLQELSLDESPYELKSLCYSSLDLLYNLMLETGINLESVPMNDPQVLKALFDGDIPAVFEYFAMDDLPALKAFCDDDYTFQTIYEEYSDIKCLKLREPYSFYDLVKICGLSHSTSAKKAAEKLLKDGLAELQEVIASREDIFNLLVSKGMERECAYKIMETVRKGKLALGHTLPEYAFEKYGLPDWYMDTCKTIEYLFPKAYAVSYAKSAVELMWFRLNHPEAYNMIVNKI